MTTIPRQRLEYLDELLMACGWTKDGDNNWLAPARFRNALARELGAGHVTRALALSAQVQFDEHCCAVLAG